ncbi:MAG: hypothetical protein HY706_12665 [Candidatus Hydrogenedentes bacterium]|nr:hypothetical protein [Candidatus Hydrogenedentota bacterium]
MRTAGYADCFIVVNGPEDGTEHPIVRTPLYLGQDSTCAVQIRLDTSIQGLSALVTAVSEGYRVRRMDMTPIFVDGKRAGRFRSRIVRSGGYVQVGNTLLCMECVPDGLASRSHGIVSESDVGWLFQHFVRRFFGLFRALLGFVTGIFTRILTSGMGIFAILVLLYFFWPAFHYRVNQVVGIGIGVVRTLIWRAFQGG